MAFRLALTNSEIESSLFVNYIDASRIGYTLEPGIYENKDMNLMLKSLLPDDVELNIKIDDIRLKSNSTTNKTLKFTKMAFFYTILCFTRSHSRPLGDNERFIQLIPGT